MQAGEEVVCFSISDDMSASGNVMRLAAKALHAEDKIKVVNSANLSTGIGLLVIEAAIMAGSALKLHPKIVVENGKSFHYPFRMQNRTC